MQWLTRVATVDTFGCNLLGAVLLLIYVCAVGKLSAPDDHANRDWNHFVMVSTALCVATADLSWRLATTGVSRWVRWFSPFAGGCLLWAPVWIMSSLVWGTIAASRLR